MYFTNVQDTSDELRKKAPNARQVVSIFKLFPWLHFNLLIETVSQKESNLQLVLRNLPDIEIHYTFSPQSTTLVQTFILFHTWFLRACFLISKMEIIIPALSLSLDFSEVQINRCL